MPVGDFIFRLKCIGAVLELFAAILPAMILPLVQALFSLRLNFSFTPKIEPFACGMQAVFYSYIYIHIYILIDSYIYIYI